MSPTSGVSSAPQRLSWAVDLLDVQATDRILEIGGGTGVAADPICQRLERGALLAVDRSATAIAAASARNAGHVAAGRARFETRALEDLEPTAIGVFDKVLAVNVNHFWTRSALAELRLIADLLRPGGQLHLVYDPPGTEQRARLGAKLADHLTAAGYRFGTATPPAGHTTLYAVTAIPSSQVRKEHPGGGR